MIEAATTSDSLSQRLGFPILLAAAAAISLGMFLLSWGHPLTDLHGFRQAQTAISVYWMLNGGAWFDYWTPVFGPPWSAPFEFPLYHWITAALVRITGLGIDKVGRLVSYCWVIAGAIPARALARDYRFPRLAFPFAAILVLASPIYAFWGRSFMIESQAVTLSLIFLLFARRALVHGSATTVAAALIAGSAAALTKITTAFPFFLLAGVTASRQFLVSDWKARALLAMQAALALGLPALLFLLWNDRADSLKAANDVATMTRSGAPMMASWNFGTLEQRFGLDMIRAQCRAALDMFGLGAPLLLPVTAWALVRARPKRADVGRLVALALLYLLPWMISTNLHVVHEYYQTGNAVFAIAAVALALAIVASRGNMLDATLLCGLFVLSQAARIATYQAQSLFSDSTELRLAKVVKDTTRPEQLILTYGLDWSPVVPYYAERRARMEPFWTTPSQYRTRLPAPDLRASSHIGAVVHCPSDIDHDPVAAARFQQLARTNRSVQIETCTIYLPKF